MKILLDENIPAKVEYDFGEGYVVKTIRDMDWLGKKNGELLGLAAFNGFDIFVTLDKNLKNQQNLNRVDLKFILLLAKNNKHQTIQPYFDKIRMLLQSSSDVPKFSEISLD